MVVLGVTLIICAPIVNTALYSMMLVNRQGVVIDEDECTRFEGSYAYKFSLSQGQKLIIRFSVYYKNVSATLRIYGAGRYNMELSENDTAPSSVTGRYFLVSTPSYYTHPDNVGSGVTNTVTATYDDNYNIEFMGDGSNGTPNIWSEPGDYVVLVYGSNSGSTEDKDVTFNIRISADGLGSMLNTLFLVVGWFLVGLAALSLIKEGRKRIGGA